MSEIQVSEIFGFNVQNQENLMKKTRQNDQKPQIWENLDPLYLILGQTIFYEVRAPRL